MKVFSRALLVLAISGLAMTSPMAKADTFQFTFTGALFSGTGQFTGTEVGSTNVYNLSAVTGSVTQTFGPASTITGLVAVNGFQGNDNKLIYPGAGLFGNAYFDAKGVSFNLANGNDVNLNDTLGFENAVGGPPKGFDFTEFDVVDVDKTSAAAPEPSSLVLLGTGLLGFGGVLRRKFKAA